jgi:hypothetical protein
VEWIHLAQDRIVAGSFEEGGPSRSSGCINEGDLFPIWVNASFSGRSAFHRVTRSSLVQFLSSPEAPVSFESYQNAVRASGSLQESQGVSHHHHVSN